MTKKSSVRIAALSDIHIRDTMEGFSQKLFQQISQNADILVLGGDLTQHGLPKEAEVLTKELSYATIPVVGVLGNHDFENGQEHEVKKILSKSMHLLEGNPTEVHGIGFAGVKGFGGGFHKYMLGAFGEQVIKAFVDEAVKEALQLENALSQLRTQHKVVVMHYAPIPQTCVGEPPEIFPFLGSSRLSEPIDQLNTTAVFHGHAHYGSPSGKTLAGIPVYNVAYELMKKHSPTKPYKLYTIST